MSATPIPPLPANPSPHGANSKILLSITVGAISAFIILILAFGAWTITRGQTSNNLIPLQDGTSTNRPQQGAATLQYWNELRELDKVQISKVEAVFGKTPPDLTDPAQKLDTLFKIADLFQGILPQWEDSVAKLPMLNVDEALLSHTRDEVQSSEEMKDTLVNLTAAARALAQWSESRDSLPEGFLGDLIDSFASGMMGRPFEGYNKWKAKQAQLDAQGQQLTQAYLNYGEQLDRLIAKSKQGEIKELQLRSELTSKYGLEFPARPQPFDGK